MALKSPVVAQKSPTVALKGKMVALFPLSALPFMLSFISFTSCVILPNSDRIILHSLSKINCQVCMQFSKGTFAAKSFANDSFRICGWLIIRPWDFLTEHLCSEIDIICGHLHNFICKCIVNFHFLWFLFFFSSLKNKIEKYSFRKKCRFEKNKNWPLDNLCLAFRFLLNQHRPNNSKT